jgi:hypothetical protein
VATHHRVGQLADTGLNGTFRLCNGTRVIVKEIILTGCTKGKISSFPGFTTLTLSIYCICLVIQKSWTAPGSPAIFWWQHITGMGNREILPEVGHSSPAMEPLLIVKAIIMV